MQVKLKACLLITIILVSGLMNGAENLFGNKDLSAQYNWGAVSNIPAGTGEAKIESEILNLTRKKSGGDFKFYKAFPKMEEGVEYRFLCKLKKSGGGSGQMRIIALEKGKFDILFSQKIDQADEWVTIDAVFKAPEASKMTLAQFFAPDEIDGSLAVTQMTLLPAAQATAATALNPVVIEKKYKPAAEAAVPGLTPYIEKNILMNGDFSLKQLDLDLPRFWQAGYGMETAEHWPLYAVKDGRCIFKSPFRFKQTLDITQEIPTAYTLSFSAAIESGTLLCGVGYRDLVNSSDSAISMKSFPAKSSRQNYSFDFESKPELMAGSLLISFSAKGGTVDLGEVTLKPAKPKACGKEKGLFIESKQKMYPARGICIPDLYSYYDLKAAKYLRKYLFLASGKYLDIYLAKKSDVKENSGLIYVGCEFAGDKERSGIRPGGFAIHSGEGMVRIAGCDNDDGVIQGAFAALRKLGVTFYTEANYELPADETLCLPEFTVERNPAFPMRFAGNGDRTSFNALGYSDQFLWADPRRLGRWLYNEHTASFLVDPNIYFKGHPEYYAMNAKGERKYPDRGVVDIHLCMSNPQVQEIAIRNMLWWMEAEPWAKLFFVGGGDGDGWCQCPNCRAWDVGGSHPSQGYLSDRNFRFINIIAREAAKKYPDKMIATLAYTGCRKAPLKENLEKNVVIFYCTYPPVWNCNRHAFCSENLHGWEEYNEWITQYPGKIFIYDYPQGGKTPNGGLYALIQKLRMYAAGNCKGIYYCGWDTFQKEFNYVIGKMLWEPNLNAESEIDKFMKYYYGKDAYPYFREYFSLVAEKEMAQSLHRQEKEIRIEPQQGFVMVNHDFYKKGKALLDQALTAVEKNKSRGFEDIEKQKLYLQTEYVLNYNKTGGLKGEALAEFARNLGEVVALDKKYNFPYPVWWLSMREMLATRAQIDIGDAKPWQASPVIAELLKDPVAMIARQTVSYEKTADSLKFDLSMMAGGEGLKNYQSEKIPKTVRQYARVLRRASSPFSGLTTTFELNKKPDKDATIRLEGLDDEKPGRAACEVLLNGKTVFSGENTFAEDDWSGMEIKIPDGILKQGENTMIIRNTTQDKSLPQGTTQLQEKPQEDYSWGWIMISGVKLKIP